MATSKADKSEKVEDLDERIETLLSDMKVAAEHLEKGFDYESAPSVLDRDKAVTQVSESPEPEPEEEEDAEADVAAQDEAETEVADDVETQEEGKPESTDAVAAETDEEAPTGETTPEEAPEPQEASETEEAEPVAALAEEVDQLLAKASSADSSSGEAKESIESLDSQLADLADGLIAGDIANERGDVQESVEAQSPAQEETESEVEPEPTSASASAAPPPSPPATRSDDKSKLSPNAPKADAPNDTPASDSQEDVETEPADETEAVAKPAAAVKEAVPPLARLKTMGLNLLAFMRQKIVEGFGAIKPQLAKALRAASAPLDKYPPVFRASIGWLGIVTLFNAACIWGFTFLREPKSPEPSQQGVEIEGSAQLQSDASDDVD